MNNEFEILWKKRDQLKDSVILCLE